MQIALIILLNFISGAIILVQGVNVMTGGLEKANTFMMEKVLRLFAGNTVTAFITGIITSALAQSSTAVTLITVSLANSGILKLSQAVGIIYGANIGTTITAQLMSFNITGIALPVILLGLTIKFLFRKRNLSNVGTAVTGFGLMLLGLLILNSGVPLIRENSLAFKLFQKYGNNPLMGLLIGMVATMLVHSSSATVGLTIVLFNAGLISFEAAVGLTMGDNIGTCITAQMASIGTNIHARRTAWAHTLYNIIGVAIVFMAFTPFMKLVRFVTSLAGHDSSRLVANTHTLFNVLSAVLFLPFTRYYVKFLEWLIPEN